MPNVDHIAKAGYESFHAGMQWERDAQELVKNEWRVTAARVRSTRPHIGQFLYDARSIPTVVKRWDENTAAEQKRHQSAGEAMLKAQQAGPTPDPTVLEN